MAQLEIGIGLLSVACSWVEFKSFIASKMLRHQYVEDDTAYTVFSFDGNIVYRTTIWKQTDGVQGVDLVVNAQALAEFEGGYKTLANAPLTPRDPDGKPLSANIKPDRPKLTKISHNFCNVTTWYSTAERVVNEVATDSGDHQHYALAHTPVDAYHGKITFEDLLRDKDGNSYRVTILVNGVAKVERDPHYGAGGDFEIDYANKTVAFFTALDVADVVSVTYHKIGNSIYKFGAVPGKKLIIDHVEVQFSDDCELKDTFIFQAHGPVDIFAPQLMLPPYNLPSGTMIPLGDPLVYKTFLDLLADSNNSYPLYPAFGGQGWRALPRPSYLFTWTYEVGSTVLNGNYGMEIWVWMEHHQPCGGAFGIASIYATSEDL
jgi:hypothetical protein